MNCYQRQAKGAIAFAFGLLISCFCPSRFVLTVAAAVIIILALSLKKCR